MEGWEDEDRGMLNHLQQSQVQYSGNNSKEVNGNDIYRPNRGCSVILGVWVKVQKVNVEFATSLFTTPVQTHKILNNFLLL